MNWNGRGRKRSWLKLRQCPEIYLMGLRKWWYCRICGGVPSRHHQITC